MTKGKRQRKRVGWFAPRPPQAWLKDLAGGIIVALVSIPISMGYAQIAGLPMQYGLYGSVIPILLFGLLTSSHDFVFGVDAAPAALVGTTLAALGIPSESERACQVVPMIALLAAGWLLLFRLFKAGRMVRYISEAVMGGFVSGICCTIILMQVPKLFGGSPGIGEVPELIRHLIGQLPQFNGYALLMGLSVIAVIVLFRRLAPKIPMSVIMMAVGVVLTVCLPLTDYGVKLLPEVPAGLPRPVRPLTSLPMDDLSDLLFDSLSIAAVILAESLLASKSNAVKDGYDLRPNREITAYALANAAASVAGCCPVNGSVSRTGIVRQFGVKTQWMSVFAALTMVLVLLFGTNFIAWLPVPVLTAIVISALSGACEFKLAHRLWKTDRKEFAIFGAAFLGVLIFGTVYGVIIGIVLSFVSVLVRAVTPPRAFLGIIPCKEGFYSLDRHKEALPLRQAILYRFGGNLFFANVEVLKKDLAAAVTPDTRCIIIHAGAVSSIDVTAAEELLRLYRFYREQNIRLYLTEHIGEINDRLRQYGAAELLKNGAVRMTVPLALRDAGIRKPYELVTPTNDAETADTVPAHPIAAQDQRGLQAELDWALGDGAEAFKQQITEEIYTAIKNDEVLTTDTIEKIESLSRFGRLNFYDEEELLDRLETRLLNRALRHPEQAERIEAVLEERRRLIESRMPEMDADALSRIREHRLQAARELYREDPEAFAQRRQKRLSHLKTLSQVNPSLAAAYQAVYQDILTLRLGEQEDDEW